MQSVVRVTTSKCHKPLSTAHGSLFATGWPLWTVEAESGPCLSVYCEPYEVYGLNESMFACAASHSPQAPSYPPSFQLPQYGSASTAGSLVSWMRLSVARSIRKISTGCGSSRYP